MGYVRVDVGAQVGSGGLYNNQVNPSKPLKVADLKVGEWKFRIRMIGDRVSVWLNGDGYRQCYIGNYWDRSLPIFPIEQIELQAHGSKVAYRDIYIKEFERPEPFRLSEEEEKEGFRVLFDGTNMHEWTGNTKDYVLEDGNIVMHPSKSFGGNLYTKDEFDNFVLRFEFMLTPGANNGLGIRTPMRKVMLLTWEWNFRYSTTKRPSIRPSALSVSRVGLRSDSGQERIPETDRRMELSGSDCRRRPHQSDSQRHHHT